MTGTAYLALRIQGWPEHELPAPSMSDIDVDVQHAVIQCAIPMSTRIPFLFLRTELYRAIDPDELPQIADDMKISIRIGEEVFAGETFAHGLQPLETSLQ